MNTIEELTKRIEALEKKIETIAQKLELFAETQRYETYYDPRIGRKALKAETKEEQEQVKESIQQRKHANIFIFLLIMGIFVLYIILLAAGYLKR